MQPDTIFATATPLQASPAAMVRVSGPLAPQLATTLLGLDWQRACRPGTLTLLDSPVPALALTLPAPRTFSGEDTLEFILPGNLHLVAALEQQLRAHGCREAEPGEFTRRALAGHKLDLSRAEGLLHLINAGTDAQRRAALRDLSGESSRQLRELAEQLRRLSARYEMSFDFSEEEHADAGGHGLRDELAGITASISGFIPPPGRSTGMPTAALFGPPNAGKSSLFNALVGHTRALVSPIPGTTRDPVDAELGFGGARILLRDLSGVGRSDADTGRFSDSAREAALSADLLLLVCGPGDEAELAASFHELCAKDPDLRARSLWVQTKSDLAPHTAAPPGAAPPGMQALRVSAVTGSGMPELRHRLQQAVSELAGAGLQTLLSQRAAEAVARLKPHLADADAPPEATAADVRVALRLLDEALLSDAPGDVLDLIFSQFCIGK